MRRQYRAATRTGNAAIFVAWWLTALDRESYRLLSASQKLIFRIVPPMPTSHPAYGLENETAQQPVTPGSTYHVVPSSGVHAAPPVSAVTTT